jgi:hypothetical protein
MGMMVGLLLMAAPVAGDVAKAGWLAGAWVERKADGSWTEKYWTPVRGKLMIGAGLTGKGGVLGHFEQMRIETAADGSVSFVALPKGLNPTRFALVRQSADELVFENAANDYPQRVTYRREGNQLVGIISQLDGSRETRWTYSRP